MYYKRLFQLYQVGFKINTDLVVLSQLQCSVIILSLVVGAIVAELFVGNG